MEYKRFEESVYGKTAIITGGTSGIGKTCVEVFCAAGVNVITMGRSVENGKKLEQTINEQNKGKCTFYECNIKNSTRLKEIIELSVEEFGRLDILVNCAGYFPEQKPIDCISKEMFEDVLETNLTAYFMGCKYSLPYLRTSKGSIINIGSVVGTVGAEGALAYSCTKGAISSFTRSLAIDEARNGVRVNEVKPGHIATEMFELTTSKVKNPDAYIDYFDHVQWMGRGGRAQEVAYMVLFLGSDWASFITGESIHVSGGYEIGQGVKVPNELLVWGKMERK